MKVRQASRGSRKGIAETKANPVVKNSSPAPLNRMHKRPKRGSDVWRAAYNVELKLIPQETGISELQVLSAVPQDIETRALVLLRASEMSVKDWCDCHLRENAGRAKTKTTLSVNIPFDTISRLAESDAMFNVALAALQVEGTDNLKGEVPALMLHCLHIQAMWESQPGMGDLFDLAEQTKTLYEINCGVYEQMQLADESLAKAYRSVLDDIESRIPIPLDLEPWLLGQRGGAFEDSAAAMRGWFIRLLGRDLPPSTNARWTVVSDLLSIIGIDAVTPAYVRTVMTRVGPLEFDDYLKDTD